MGVSSVAVIISEEIFKDPSTPKELKQFFDKNLEECKFLGHHCYYRVGYDCYLESILSGEEWNSASFDKTRFLSKEIKDKLDSDFLNEDGEKYEEDAYEAFYDWEERMEKKCLIFQQSSNY